MKIEQFIIAGLLCTSAQAQQFDPLELQRQATLAPMNAYRFIGNALVCKTDRPEFSPNACNRIGAIAVGDDWTAASAKLGKPSRVIPGKDGVKAHVYFLQASSGSQAYWVLEKSEATNKVVSVQLTGYFKVPGASFSSIELTDPEEKVRQLLGHRFAVRPVPQIKGVMWDYSPFKISVEFVNGRVYSIRVGEES